MKPAPSSRCTRGWALPGHSPPARRIQAFARVTGLTDAEKGATWWYDAALGGGAYLDYCCYGAALALWFFDHQPTYATGIRANLASPFATADDTGVLILHFDNGLAVAEATRTSIDPGGLHGPVVYGSRAIRFTHF